MMSDIPELQMPYSRNPVIPLPTFMVENNPIMTPVY